MCAKNLVKVIRNAEVMSRKRLPILILGSFHSSSAIKIVLSKHVVSIMRIINIIINMDDIRQERPNESSVLKLNKKLKQSH